MAGQQPRRRPPKTARAWLATHYSVPARIVAVLGTLASAWGLVIAVGDPDGENPASWLMFLGPAVAGAFPTLELAWARDRDLSMRSIQARWFAFPFFGAAGAVVAMLATELTLHATGAIAAAQAADKWHYWFAADGPPLPSIMFGLLGYVAGLLLALAFFVVVLWPLQVLLRPRQAMAEHSLDTSEANFRRNRAALLLMPFLVINAVVIAIALTFGIGWLAVASILLEVALVVVTVTLQRVDTKRRKASGVRTGVENGVEAGNRRRREY
ncbi:hypothetical protein [Glycomyces terrestris]|uniref:Uncharacterized protein n=1 Tax=Glycomyces terrestris TaxID=2493553 RepID=A0A426V4H9_9ACTN|nr:hypothetical protein [Glycomyces terrestris]RRS01728.1 hypothetical protein EIW28_02920 [Glycomyces terrestris]